MAILKSFAFSLLLAAFSKPIMAHGLSDSEIRKSLSLPDSAVVSDWPGVADRTIVAYTSDPRPTHDEKGAEVEGVQDIDLTILIIKRSDGKVMQRYFSEGAYSSDAMQFDGISLDLANYTIKPGVRAFGVRSGSSHNWCANSVMQSIQLYEIAGSSLHPVLHDLTMTPSNSMCDCGGTENRKRTIEIGKTMHNGYFDLIVHEKMVNVDQEKVGDECKERESRTQHKYLLRFDGKEYAHPDVY